MSWLSPAAAWWLLLVPALVALYMFRPRARRKPVSSLRLWQALPRVDRPRLSVRRPPLSLLLLLQALLLLAGAIALIQPAFSAPAPRLDVILLDASGSMQTMENGTSRFQQARNEALRLASSMRSEDRATLLRVGAGVSTACSACNRGDLETALSAMRPGAGEADWGQALDLAAGLSRRSEEGLVDTHVISDGAFEPLTAEVLPASLHFTQVGNSSDNRAITVLSARRPPDGSPGYVAYARVENISGAAVAIDVEATADTVPLPARSIDLEAGGHADLIYQIPVGTVKFSLSINPSDALAADDTAALFLPAEGQFGVRVISEDTGLYTRVLAGISGIQTVISDTQGTPGQAPAFTIIEGVLPDTLPAGSLLLVNPQGEGGQGNHIGLPLLPAAKEKMNDVRPQAGATAHPILSGIDLAPLIVDEAFNFEPVSWLEPVLNGDEQSGGGSLILAGERDGRRIVVLSFDPRDSNLPKLVAFPLLMYNVADWLYPLAGKEALRPGEPLYLGAGALLVSPSDNKQVGDSGVFVDTEDAGIYRVTSGEAEDNQLQFAVNMENIRESSIAPRPHPELNTPAGNGEEQLVTKEYWSPLAALALLLAGTEWLFYCWKRGQA